MKILSKNHFEHISTWMNREARRLERALFNFNFVKSDEQELAEALAFYQNADGGFGQGLEPDFQLKDSSAMATSIGLRHLRKIDHTASGVDMIAGAIGYLETAFDPDRKGWFSVPKAVNDYPHAPWWEFKDEIKMTVIDYSWGNPTAELIGYLYKYREYLQKIDIEPLLDFAINYLNSRKDFNSEHEVFCFIKLFNLLGGAYEDRMANVLHTAVQQLVNTDEREWANYVPTPLRFVEADSDNYFGIKQNDIDSNLDYLITLFEKNGEITPAWEWGIYPEAWEQAKKEWTGILTLEAMLSLQKFGRIAL